MKPELIPVDPLFHPCHEAISQAFARFRKNGNDEYSLMRFSALAKMMYDRYNAYIKEGLFPKIEDLTAEHKNFYWNKVKGFYNNQEMQIKAAKAAYILDMITLNTEQ